MVRAPEDSSLRTYFYSKNLANFAEGNCGTMGKRLLTYCGDACGHVMMEKRKWRWGENFFENIMGSCLPC